MAKPLPIGFSNWKTHFFANLAVANNFYIKGSFIGSDGTNYQVFRGPNIASTTAANPTVVTTSEAHGFHVGQTIQIEGMPNAVSAMNASWVITAVGSSTTFTIGFNSTGLGTTTGRGIAGVDSGLKVPVANYAYTPGANCVDDYPAAHELPWEG